MRIQTPDPGHEGDAERCLVTRLSINPQIYNITSAKKKKQISKAKFRYCLYIWFDPCPF